MLGSTEPRLWTPPLRELTPETSYGFDVIDFARDVLGTPLDPWEEWTVIHAGELLPDGRPRFRQLLILVARQNGKTYLLVVLALYWLFVEDQKLVLGMSTTADYAKEAWEKAVELAQDTPELADLVPRNGIRRVNGDITFTTAAGNRYKIAAANRRGGRSLTINRLIIDELREHRDFVAWNAATNACNAVLDAQIFTITNQGDAEAVVLDSLRTPAIQFIETGEGDYRLGLFEYSAPQGSDPTDVHALAMANPNLGRRVDAEALLLAGRRALMAGGEELTGFKTEVMCMRVHQLDPAVDPDRWDALGVDEPFDFREHRDKTALCLDISPDARHATLAAAALIDGKVRTGIVKAWDGFGCLKDVREELPEILQRSKVRAFGWFPKSPAAAVAVDIREATGRRALPRQTVVEELKTELPVITMGFAALVDAGDVQHQRDDLLTSHVHAAQKLRLPGDVWTFTRAGDQPVDAAYAAAGATHLARTLPPPRGPLTVVTVSTSG